MSPMLSSFMNVMNKRLPTAPNNEPTIHGIGRDTRDQADG